MPKPGHGRIYGGIYACTGEVANEIAESMRRRRRTNNGDMVMSLVWPAERVILHECWQVVTMSAAAREMLMEKTGDVAISRRDVVTRSVATAAAAASACIKCPRHRDRSPIHRVTVT